MRALLRLAVGGAMGALVVAAQGAGSTLAGDADAPSEVGGVAEKKLSLASLFSDGMVVQRNRSVPVWGTAAPGAWVKLTLGDQRSARAKADADGKWRADLPSLGTGGPYELSVRSGGEERLVRDILAGEVWLCSGQSNMSMSLAQVHDAEKEIAAADDAHLRMFRVPEAPGEMPWPDVKATWTMCTPKTAPAWSATGYYFARKLHAELGVPVGILLSAWGGSTVSAWMSEDALDAPEIAVSMPDDVIGWRVNQRPSKLYCAMLHPLAPFAIRGVAWYQGESDAEPGQNAYLYRFLLPAMIRDWRHLWGDPDLPFYLVQLPNLQIEEEWAVLRESQAEATRLPHVGMVTTLDIGQMHDMHPTNKRDFGERLGRIVLAHEYGKPIAAESPHYRTHNGEGSAVRIRFDHTGRSLATTDGTAPKEFAIAGPEKVFVRAHARIDGDSVVVWSDRVTSPAAVRYAWSSAPAVNLVNGDGLPAAPFRTDDWPVLGQRFVGAHLPHKGRLAETFEAARVTSGTALGWQWAGNGVVPTELGAKNLVKAFDTTHVQLMVFDHLEKGLFSRSPSLAWTNNDSHGFAKADPAKGCTVEMRVQMLQASDPFDGFDMEVALKQPAGNRQAYRLSVTPMRLHGFQRREIRVLGNNLDNGSDYHTYRLAVRPDGVAQVYFDQRPIGVLVGDIDETPSAVSEFIFGKRIQAGDFVANVESVAYDLTGAYAP